MLTGQKHLVKCKCVLPQYKNAQDPPQHQFVVFSVINEDDSVRVKYTQCNNCGAIHRVTDICTSEVLPGKENMSSIVTVDDIKASLPANLVDILERNDVDPPTWEQAQFIYENKQWGNFVVLASDEDAGTKQGKYVRIMSETYFKIESFTRDDVAVLTEKK